MPIESPNLDDLRFQTVRDLLIRQIPIVAPEWTDHNDSDPGVALIQLFSYLAEQVGFRLNRVPDKNYVEFLKLIGITLRPAEAAKTLLQFILAKPETTDGFLITKGTQVKAKSGGGTAGPPTFETDADLDAVPAQMAALVTTASANLRDIKVSGDGDGSTANSDGTFISNRFTLVWDGKTPKLKDMPTQVLPVFASATNPAQSHLWIGLAFNPSGTAGFVANRVTLNIQFDDDEQPDPNADVLCLPDNVEVNRPAATVNPALPPLPTVTYEYYKPPTVLGDPSKLGSWTPLTIISDTTNSWTQSGQLRFDVPVNIGPIQDLEWTPVTQPTPMTLTDICNAANNGQGSQQPGKLIPHPLIGAIKNPVDGLPAQVTLVPISGWLHVSFATTVPSFSLRAISFNVTQATNALTVRGELLGIADGTPGQVFQLANGNIMAGSLQLGVTDPLDLTPQLHTWTEVTDFDAAAADAHVYVLDREAGQVIFGDGIHGRPPPDQQQVVAIQYRWGGGKGGEVPVGVVTKPVSVPSDVQDVVNDVAALGGKDAETLDQAKARAPRELKVLGRAVTVDDFQFLALQTQGVRVARAEVVALRKPFADLVVDGPGLDLVHVVPGALSVVIVPDATGFFPMPTDGMLRKVCEWLDRFRLVTTEVHVVPPMYVRLFDVCVRVRAKPGFSSTILRETIATRLETYFHVLTGGPDGKGFPFGSSIHHADLVAQVFQVEGVATVECAEAWFDNRMPAKDPSSDPVETWRFERATKMHLTGCVVDSATDVVVLQLGADENVFVDTSSMTVSVV